MLALVGKVGGFEFKVNALVEWLLGSRTLAFVFHGGSRSVGGGGFDTRWTPTFSREDNVGDHSVW